MEDTFVKEGKVSRRTKNKDTLTVEESGLIQRFLWRSSTCFYSGNMLVQQSTVILFCSITGTRPAVILPSISQDRDLVPGPKRRTQNQTFQSDLPKYTTVNDEIITVCWEDIELFYLRNPEGGRDVLCAIINFRNLKGRPEGADG